MKVISYVDFDEFRMEYTFTEVNEETMEIVSKYTVPAKEVYDMPDNC